MSRCRPRLHLSGVLWHACVPWERSCVSWCVRAYVCVCECAWVSICKMWSRVYTRVCSFLFSARNFRTPAMTDTCDLHNTCNAFWSRGICSGVQEFPISSGWRRKTVLINSVPSVKVKHLNMEKSNQSKSSDRDAGGSCLLKTAVFMEFNSFFYLIFDFCNGILEHMCQTEGPGAKFSPLNHIARPAGA